MKHKLFLVDSLGAAASVVAALALTQLEPWFGAPPALMFKLAGLGACFFLYSFTCYWRRVHHWRVWMRVLYCCLTAVLVTHFFERLTLLGVLFFGGEILIIAALAVAEYRTARVSSDDTKQE
jgi:hypothetical protein